MGQPGRFLRAAALCLALAVCLTVCAPPARAADTVTSQTAPAGAWLVPKAREYRAFSDTRGTICEAAAACCCETGLMDGVDARHFLPASGLTHAQILVISARLHRLLSGGTLDYFVPLSRKGPDWWKPYDAYLQAQVPALASDAGYADMTAGPANPCCREEFFRLLAAVLADTGTTLPQRSAVYAVPDCQDQAVMQFYRWGVLTGKDEYGTLQGGAALTRAAAAALLARLVDPAQRLTAAPRQLELCQVLLGVDPETVLMTVAGRAITAEEFLPTLAETVSSYNHAHFASLMLELSGGTPQGEAVKQICRLVACETLAQELHVTDTPSNQLFFSGYQGLTAAGQSWREYHDRLLQDVLKALNTQDLPADRVPQPVYAAVWATLPLDELSARVFKLPCWGGWGG